MPEPSVLLCGPALDAGESAASLDLLRQVTLPGAIRYLVTTAKFDAEGEAKTVNVETGYPADTAFLQTLLRWAEVYDLSDPRYRDGYDFYCLQQIVARSKRADFAVMLRQNAGSFQERWPELQRSVDGQLFLTTDEAVPEGLAPRPTFLIDLRDARAPAFLNAALELYRTGAVYGMETYTLRDALRIAVDALELQRNFAGIGTPDSADPRLAAETQDVAEDLATSQSA